MTPDANKTHEERLALARVLGRHMGYEIYPGDPMMREALLAIHFLTDKPRCPMCLERVAKAQEQTSGQSGIKAE